MSERVRREVDTPEYSRCSLLGIQPEIIGYCAGRVTREHAMINAGRKIQEAWAIIPLCARHHGVDQYQDAHTEAPKDMRVWVALHRASDDELLQYTRSNYLQARGRLNQRYGAYVPPPIKNSVSIHY